MSTQPRIARPARLGPFAAAVGAARGLASVVLHGPQRSTALALAAALLGLAAACAGLLRPTVREPVTTPPGVVALVNGKPILESDFVTDTEAALSLPFAQITPAQKAKSLRNMIDEELLVQRALALDLPEQDTNVRTALGDSVTALITSSSLATPPTDAQLEAYYDAHRASYATLGSMSVIDLVLHVGGFENAAQSVDQAMADAQQAVYELRSGAALDYVKDHFAFEGSTQAGEAPDFAARAYLGPKLYKVAEAMNDGEVSEPTATQDGVHVLIMEHREPPVFHDFASVRQAVYNDYIGHLKAKARADNLVFLRRNARIVLAPGASE